MSRHTGFQKLNACWPSSSCTDAANRAEAHCICVFFFTHVFAFLWSHFSVSQAVLPSLPLLRCPSLSLSAHSLSPPIPSLSTPLTLPVPSSYPASQVTMTGGFLAPISWSFSARLRAIAHACVRACVCVCVCVRARPCLCVSPQC